LHQARCEQPGIKRLHFGEGFWFSVVKTSPFFLFDAIFPGALDKK
jgi:hypothetical protein